jgi:hypothetical protein
LTILARVLMLLACVPLLLPTGFCICEAAGRCCTQVECQRAESTREKADTPKKSGCRHHHHHDDADSDTPPGDTHHHHHRPKDGQHDPGCPAASADVDRSQATEPTLGVTDVVPPVFVVAYLPFLPHPAHARVRVAPSGWPSAPPLYLSHCSLVI